MANEEYSCEVFLSDCACGRGFARYFKRYVYNDWGHKQVYNTPIEIVCDHCESRYHYEENDCSWYLVPNGVSIPQEPRPVYGFIHNVEERYAGEFTKSDLEIMLADMTAPKRRTIKDLTNRNAWQFAYDINQKIRSIALKNIKSSLREIIDNYDNLYASWEQKEKIKEKHLKEHAEAMKLYNGIISQCKKLSFSLDSTKHSPQHADTIAFWERYISEHSETDVADLEVDLTFERDFTDLFWDSYHIIKCSDPQYISLVPSWHPSKNKITKKYLCICSLCGQKEEYAATDFCIKQNSDNAYYPVPCCPCHQVSSFEAKTMDILNHHGISYIREKTFDGLVGDAGMPLRFDFALFKNRSADGSPLIDLVIELQGPHHYQKGFYGDSGDYITDDLTKSEQWEAEQRLKRQQRYDQLKQEYCSEQDIKIANIKYTTNDYTRLEKKLLKVLQDNGYDYLPESQYYMP